MKDSKTIAMQKMLDSKEKRYYKIKRFVEENKKPVLSFMLNIPGSEKNFEDAVNFHKKYIEEIKKVLEENKIEILWEEYNNLDTGMEYIALIDGDGKFIKREMMKLEEGNESGRLLDIDIYDENFRQISRANLNLPERKCIICEDVARNCIKEERHSLRELEEKVRNILRK
ncbi:MULTISPECIES: citrate lyase holo-[acyl-carrier protein] synthase [Peptoniphilus]|jgi:holo-ACP synthase citX|uniref:citrate lyase holo-[acyl-carrier protein] synthase n=1 Tax=Peptoniphilus TaxID=162289 RepID=UPI0002898FDB|nr:MULTISPECIES: citrate lyase holo-[acyl-carrier protein] synthase [Peptoniphilus]MDU1042987.1 citrate lyase holo-[acyl-carrier protein] synthase [Peptoniphilus rhinitidis]MDU1954433.1 citrate lyase holo-[acyl-carrier protein] synthase [Peptoniphilus lacydonensis]MDU2109851.1 citrate lyase holo-[acyl-carrier protein] synthase [Peptoniphilus lacydonensis]MDU3750577.1 citrate lyase holo-[acyl-carrier protein] synthase [Peptoniphilus rhinitidis]MDU5274897.1 citrate lyase holo-[acyl-carrier prote